MLENMSFVIIVICLGIGEIWVINWVEWEKKKGFRVIFCVVLIDKRGNDVRGRV